MRSFASIRLEPLVDQSPEALEALRAIRNADGVRRYMYSDHNISAHEHAVWVERTLHSDTDQAWVVRDGEALIGYAAIQQISKAHGSAEWAFYLDPAIKSSGVGSYIEFVVLDRAFGELGLEKLNCAVLDNNQAVVDLHRKFGFIHEGTRRSNIAKEGDRLDVHLLGITKAEWRSARPRFAKLFGE